MKAGNKLYDQFRKEIAALGELKLAWFTTFNLQLNFFEKYILSELVGIPAKEIRNVNDYESLNALLSGTEERKKLDVRIFHDFRALDYNEVKKTCVKVVGINPNDIGRKSLNGVFHPKVGLFVGDSGKVLLMAGSANMTFSGWGRNSEAMLFKEVRDKENGNQIFNFFWALSANEDKEMKSILRKLKRDWTSRFKERDDWYFQHSFSGKSVLDALDTRNSNLHVWSPYYSDDMADKISHELGQYNKVHIIPAMTEKGTTRISPTLKEGIQRLYHVHIWKDLRDFNSDDNQLVHAKVWLTKNKLGVGSWNFTSPGMNVRGVGKMNIEAGIIQKLKPSLCEYFFQSFPKKEITNSFEAQPESEREEEWGDTLSPWKTNICVYYDWKELKYQFSGIPGGFEVRVKLPGFDRKKRIKSDSDIFITENFTRLLSDRIYTVYDSKGNTLQIGLIIELHPQYRPAMGFETMQDFITAWVGGLPEKSSNKRPEVPDDSDMDEEAESGELEQLSGDYSNSWFPMFLAMQKMKQRIAEADGHKESLRILGFKIPGSIQQLSEKLRVECKKYRAGDSGINQVYLWFLVNEANINIKFYNKLVNRLGVKSFKVPIIKNITMSFNNLYKKEQVDQWLEYVIRTSKYG